MPGEEQDRGETLRASLSSGGPSSVCLSVCLTRGLIRHPERG